MGASLVLAENPLLKAFGDLKFGRVIAESASVIVVNQAHLGQILEQGVARQFILAAEVQALKALGATIGLLPTWADVGKVIQAFKLPQEHRLALSFNRNQCSCPVTHGVIVNSEGVQLTRQLYSVEPWLPCCLKMAYEGKFSPLDLANTLKQMLDAGMAYDQSELAKRTGIPVVVR